MAKTEKSKTSSDDSSDFHTDAANSGSCMRPFSSEDIVKRDQDKRDRANDELQRRRRRGRW
ncbi:MAG: hypothetical protein ABL893_07890 [Hyphomicrobium sp.]